MDRRWVTMGNSGTDTEILFWRAVLAEGGPSGICTAAGRAIPPWLPYEIGLLLPGPQSAGPAAMPADIPGNAALGVFLSNPLLNIGKLVEAVTSAGVRWVANLPTVAQHDPEFRGHLEDVGLGYGRETAGLRTLREAGLKTIAAVATAEDAESAAIDADMILVVPDVSAYGAGFPSAGVRSAQIAEVRRACPGYAKPLLGMLTEAEHRLPSTWPAGVDGGVIRPCAIS